MENQSASPYTPPTRPDPYNQTPSGRPWRNLIVGIDGTSNKFGQYNTNVVKLFAMIDLKPSHGGREQHAYYLSGIGARRESLKRTTRDVVSDVVNMAVARNIAESVKDAYSWLAQTFAEGDQIYLFGFSRGAYQVRMLAGMIYEVGLIRTSMEKQIDAAYAHYDAIRSGKPKAKESARRFKNTFSHDDVRVNFVGVWDTVSSEGLVRGGVFLSTPSHARHFRHALALDERRVKFMPEYFCGAGPQLDGGQSSEHHDSAINDESADSKLPPASVEEVWFAGCHSDVGGQDRLGKFRHAGNVSLLWMRQEAIANGLVMKPTDLIWTPDDLDFGTSNSMTRFWNAIEYIPIRHQVSFSGPGEDARRLHLRQPRRLVPGQKVHPSVRYANAYQPKAKIGIGFDIPAMLMEDTESNDLFLETRLFDDTAAPELVTRLGRQQKVAPIYLDRLLFMLRFDEGKRYITNVPDWKKQFTKVMNNHACAPLVRLTALVAYYEACDLKAGAHQKSQPPPQIGLSPGIFDDARRCFSDILAMHDHRDAPRVIALLRPLTKHPDLRERILTPDILNTLVHLFDAIVERQGETFGEVMNGLNSLLQCEHTQHRLVEKLEANPPNFNVSRLSRILAVKDKHLLTTALRMVLTLARISAAGARAANSVKVRIRELAKKHDKLVGHLAVEILLILYDPKERGQLNVNNSHFRANLASVVVRLIPDKDESSDVPSGLKKAYSGRQILHRIYGHGAEEFTEFQRNHVRQLRTVAECGNNRERTAATMTLLKLCETETIRTYLLEMKLLNVFIEQLRHKSSALLAAYALVKCLKYSDMKQSINDNKDLPKNIVGMLRLDYFDDAVGSMEGFQVFRDLMQHDDLRKKIKDLVNEVLYQKLGLGKPREIRTSLICLDIFRSDQNEAWTYELVARGLEHLKDPKWEVQRTGVATLSALAQTDLGVVAICKRIHEIVEMLLPLDSLQTPTLTPTTIQSANPHSPASRNMPCTPPSRMMGPVCALRILALNKTLRDHIRESTQYESLKHLCLSETLVGKRDTSPWHIYTPNRTDVVIMLDKMIRTVDGESMSSGYMSIGDVDLPDISHWDKLMKTPVVLLGILSGVIGVPVVATLAALVASPIYLFSQARRRV